MSTSPDARAWVHVRGDALRRNYRRVRSSVGPGVGIIPMVKADAYGLGLREVVAALSPEGPWGWGVATVEEGVTLRELGVSSPVIVCSPAVGPSLREAVAADLQLSVSSVEALDALIEAAKAEGRVVKLHLDVDTGMGRTGFDWSKAAEWLPRVLAAPGAHVEWVGCQTHLHSADEDAVGAREQWARLEEVLGRAGERLSGLTVHLLNSAGAFRMPEAAAGLPRAAVRPGIFLYGGRIGEGLPVPEPVISVHARVVHLRDADPGTTLGYGATYRARGPERWATLSIGYGDGLPRALGNRGRALVCGRAVPIIGRISMDMTVVDISGVPGVRSGDAATLVGSEGEEAITLDDVADLAGTISYEILTGLTRRLPRVWTGLARGS
ncbi:MAG: alanine racemase [Gemmatimonadales bacterium]